MQKPCHCGRINKNAKSQVEFAGLRRPYSPCRHHSRRPSIRHLFNTSDPYGIIKLVNLEQPNCIWIRPLHLGFGIPNLQGPTSTRSEDFLRRSQRSFMHEYKNPWEVNIKKILLSFGEHYSNVDSLLASLASADWSHPWWHLPFVFFYWGWSWYRSISNMNLRII